VLETFLLVRICHDPDRSCEPTGPLLTEQALHEMPPA
jgi:hypothetical protein